ncbi:MAG: SHOCT domain-containing protein [Gemmataceae bacterium]
MTLADELGKLADLHQSGMIDGGEFAAAKSILLAGRPWQAAAPEPAAVAAVVTSSEQAPPTAANGEKLQPHRGSLVMLIGIAGIFLPILAPVAWAIAQSDVTAMDEGRMDQAGRVNTTTGLGLGAVFTLLYGAAIAYAISNR